MVNVEITYFRLRLIVDYKFSIFDYMESILIHPESVEQLKTVKAVLKALKVQFEPQSNTLPPHILKSIEIGVKQAENGETISFEEFKEKHFSKG